jgi:hypothetical protein
MHSEGKRRKKKRKQLRNMCMIARTCIPRGREEKKKEKE